MFFAIQFCYTMPKLQKLSSTITDYFHCHPQVGVLKDCFEIHSSNRGESTVQPSVLNKEIREKYSLLSKVGAIDHQDKQNRHKPESLPEAREGRSKSGSLEVNGIKKIQCYLQQSFSERKTQLNRLLSRYFFTH